MPGMRLLLRCCCGNTVPASALLDENGEPVLDENGDYILDGS